MIAEIFAASALSLDAVSVGQWMFSRPIVAGTLIGWTSGNAALGLAAGCLVELLWVTVIPVGKALPPDGTAVAALAVYWANHSGGYPVLGLALAAAIPFGIFSKKGDFFMRGKFSDWNKWILNRMDHHKDPCLEGVTAASLLIAFAKSSCFYALCLPTGTWLIRMSAGPVSALLPTEWVAAAGGALGCAVVYDSLERK